MLNRLEPRQNKIEQGPLINNLRLHSGTVLPVCITGEVRQKGGIKV